MEVTIKYGVDIEEDQTSPVHTHVECRERTFSSLEQATPFIYSCTQVYNLDEVLSQENDKMVFVLNKMIMKNYEF